MLGPTVFHTITTYFGMPNIDLFASRHNAQIISYAAWQPDPNAKFIDALSIDWHQFELVYAFPPFLF